MIQVKSLSAKQVADFLQVELIGNDKTICGVTSLDKVKKNMLAFIHKPIYSEPDTGAILLVSKHKKLNLPNTNTYLLCDAPRMAFTKVINELVYKRPPSSIAPTAIIHPSAKLGNGCLISEYVVIGEQVVIGDNVEIHAGTIIRHNVQIGGESIIASGVVIGEDGLGCQPNESGNLICIRHLGGVRIGKQVMIGPNCTIQRGTIDDTCIGNYTKLSQMVSVGHNTIIGKNNRIAGMAHISGRARIGDHCFIGANCTLKDGSTIGNQVKIGAGAIVDGVINDGSIISGAEMLTLATLNK
ncbi:MAG: DapH/DapD/GlmU-related protein [Coxiellaceae bacterium]|nr:DapH/DapD/GlmU-related protein [Coxiellaceae bacterium]